MATQLPYNMIGSAEAADAAKGEDRCRGQTHRLYPLLGGCCAIDAVVKNGVWIRQEPVFDSPINLGAHCAKGASVREHGHGEHRLKYPMKLVDGKYTRRSVGSRRLTRLARSCSRSAKKVARMPLTGSVHRSRATSRLTCCASSCPSSVPTTWTTRPASATRPRSPVSPIPGVMVR
jgi:predicted molibdopterin-dependent oxidoreductase YjgC